MKKLYATIIALMAIAMSASADTFGTRMYLLGEATPSGWNLNKDMTMMETIEVGKYQWIGHLKEGYFRFKVNCTSGDWKNCYGPAENGADFVSGVLVFWSNETEGEAPSYNNKVEGDYKVEIDLTGSAPMITVSDGTGLTPSDVKADYPHYIYPIGNALSCGWSPDVAKWSPLKETAFNSGIYKGAIELIGEGELKFLHQGDWGDQYGPVEGGYEIAALGDYDICKPSVDNKFNNKLTGTYDIIVNAKEGKMTIAEYGTGIKTINAAKTADAIYNISGTRLATPQRGINIVNGKKIIY